MHDINLVRENPEAFDKALQQRNAEPAAAALIACDDARKAAIAKAQALQTTRNEASKKIGQAKGAGDDAVAEELMAQVAELKSALQVAEDEERKLKAELERRFRFCPIFLWRMYLKVWMKTTIKKYAKSERLGVSMRRRNISKSAKRWGKWILRRRRLCRVRVLLYCATTLPDWSAPWAISCSTCTLPSSVTGK